MIKGLAPNKDNLTLLSVQSEIYLGECSNIDMGNATLHDDTPHERAWTFCLL
jgi:hypothetical protein